MTDHPLIDEIVSECSQMYGWNGGKGDPEPALIRPVVLGVLGYLEERFGFVLPATPTAQIIPPPSPKD